MNFKKNGFYHIAELSFLVPPPLFTKQKMLYSQVNNSVFIASGAHCMSFKTTMDCLLNSYK